MKSIKSDSDAQKMSSVSQEKINRGDTAELAETVMTKKRKIRSPVFSGKNRGVTPSVAARVSLTLVTPLNITYITYKNTPECHFHQKETWLARFLYTTPFSTA